MLGTQPTLGGGAPVPGHGHHPRSPDMGSAWPYLQHMADKPQFQPDRWWEPGTRPASRWSAKRIGIVAVVVGALLLGVRMLVPSSPEPEYRNGGIRQVRYSVEGTALNADVTYTDGSGGIRQQSDVQVGGNAVAIEVPSGRAVSFSAQNKTDSGDVTCVITVDGVEVKRITSTGAYVIASCSAMVP